MAYYEITNFDGTAIVSAPNREMTHYKTDAPVLSRIVVLESGAKFDADGTAAADVSFGRIEARYVIRPTSSGNYLTNYQTNILTSLRGKRGTLTGLEYSYTGDTSAPYTRTCTARCVDVIEEEYDIKRRPKIKTAVRGFTYVTMVWEQLTDWS